MACRHAPCCGDGARLPWLGVPSGPPEEAVASPQFTMERKGRDVISVDARPWRYTLLRYPDGKFEIIVEQPNLAGVNDSDRYCAAVLLLDGLLGEAVRLSTIVGIETTHVLDPAHAQSAAPLSI